MEIHLKIWYNSLSEVFMRRKTGFAYPKTTEYTMDSFYTER